jgi:hypothetical protein
MQIGYDFILERKTFNETKRNKYNTTTTQLDSASFLNRDAAVQEMMKRATDEVNAGAKWISWDSYSFELDENHQQNLRGFISTNSVQRYHLYRKTHYLTDGTVYENDIDEDDEYSRLANRMLTYNADSFLYSPHNITLKYGADEMLAAITFIPDDHSLITTLEIREHELYTEWRAKVKAHNDAAIEAAVLAKELAEYPA